MIVRKLKGHSLQDVLNLYMPQFYYLIDCLSKEFEELDKAYKKANRKH